MAMDLDILIFILMKRFNFFDHISIKMLKIDLFSSD